MLGIIFKSLQKSRRLRKISKILGDRKVRPLQLSEKYLEQTAKKEEALEHLIDMCFKYDFLKVIIDEYGVSREYLKEMYWLLCVNGAGQWVKGHYVPASALVFPETLKACCEQSKNPKGGLRDLAYAMVEEFNQ